MQGYLLVLYLGGVFYYAFTYKRMGDGATLGLYAFLYLFGGILFHLISETKSQYTSTLYLLTNSNDCGGLQPYDTNT